MDTEKLEGLRRFTYHWLHTPQPGASQNTAGSIQAPLTFTRRSSLAAEDAEVSVLQQLPQYSSPQGLIRTSNGAFNKLSFTLSYVAFHIAALQREAEAEFYPMLALMALQSTGIPVAATTTTAANSAAASHQLQYALSLAHSLDKWQRLQALVISLTNLCGNLLEQLGALCAAQTRKATILKGEHAVTAFKVLGEGLAVMARIDALIVDNVRIAAAFTQLDRLLQMSAATAGDNDTGNRAAPAKKAVAELQAAFIGKGTLRQFLDTHLAPGGHLADACADPPFKNALANIIRVQVDQGVGRIEGGRQHIGDRESLLGWFVLGVVHCHLCPDASSLDRKLLRLLLQLHHKVPLLPVFMHISCQPAAFLSQYLPSCTDAYLPARYTSQAAALRLAQLEQMMSSYINKQESVALTVIAWSARFGSLLAPQRSNDALLSQIAAAAVEGTRMRTALVAEAQSVLSMHSLTGASLPACGLHAMMRHIGLAKAIESAFSQHHFALADALPYLVTHCKSRLQGALEAVIAALKARKRGAQAATLRRVTLMAIDDACVAAEAAVHLALGPVSTSHIAALQQCMDALLATSMLAEAERHRIEDLLLELNVLIFHTPKCHHAGSCASLYFHPKLMVAWLANLMARPHAAARLQHAISAFADAGALLQHAGKHTDDLIQELQDRLLKAIQSQVLEPVALQVEMDLRRQLPAAQEAAGNAAESSPSKPLTVLPLLRLSPLRVMKHSIHIRHWVERHLAAIFQEYTANAPQDWQSYALMTSLAQQQYGLQMANPALPPRTIEQGMDMASIVQAFPDFVAGVGYSATPQGFLQLPESMLFSQASSKFLLTLEPRHILQALWTHGNGLAEAAVQAAFSCLARCVAALLQWMQQDAVAARLHKEAASMEETGSSSMEAAESFASDLHRLGAGPDGHGHLQYLRSLLTRVGNALGFVRMVQLATVQLTSTETQLCPVTCQPQPVSPALQDVNVVSETRTAAQMFDEVVSRPHTQPPAGPDWLSSFVGLLSQRLASVSGTASCYAAVPAVTIVWLEARLLAQERLSHGRRPSEATDAAGTSGVSAFMDDGFAFGVAFMLKVLKQDAAFDALRWFDTVQAYLRAAGHVPSTPPSSTAALPARFGRWVLSSIGLTDSQPAFPDPRTQPSSSRHVAGAFSGLDIPPTSATPHDDGLAGLGLMSLPAVQQQPAYAHTTQLRASQAESSATEALHLAQTIQIARTLL